MDKGLVPPNVLTPTGKDTHSAEKKKEAEEELGAISQTIRGSYTESSARDDVGVFEPPRLVDAAGHELINKNTRFETAAGL